jgi:hypothetical protein
MATADSTVTYKDIPGHPGYRVGDDGSVWSCLVRFHEKGKVGSSSVIGDTWHRLSPGPMSTSDHLRVNLRGHIRAVHQLVLEAFVGPCPVGLECCHEDDDPTNNRLTNLRWGTRESNISDRFRHGTFLIGESHYIAKLTEDSVRQIRADGAAGLGSSELASKYKVSRQTIRGVIARRTWKHVA